MVWSRDEGFLTPKGVFPSSLSLRKVLMTVPVAVPARRERLVEHLPRFSLDLLLFPHRSPQYISWLPPQRRGKSSHTSSADYLDPKADEVVSLALRMIPATVPPAEQLGYLLYAPFLSIYELY